MEIKGPKMIGIFILLLASVAEANAAVATCNQPKETGPCRALLRRWFFNKGTGKCEQFNYGGCRGNTNNFKSQALCEQECGTGTPSGAPKIPPPPGPLKHGGADRPVGMPPTSTKSGTRPQKWQQQNMNGNGRISFNVKSDFPSVPKYQRHPAVLYRPEPPSAAGGTTKNPQVRPNAGPKPLMAGRLSTNQASMTTKPATFSGGGSGGTGLSQKAQGGGKTQDSEVVYLTNQGQSGQAKAASKSSKVQTAPVTQGQAGVQGSREHWEKTQAASNGPSAQSSPAESTSSQGQMTVQGSREHWEKTQAASNGPSAQSSPAESTSSQGQMTVQGSREHWEKTRRSQIQAASQGPKTQVAAQVSQGQPAAQDPREHVILLRTSAQGSQGKAVVASGNTPSSGQQQQSKTISFGTNMVGSSTFQTRTRSEAHSDHSHSHPPTKTKSTGLTTRRKIGGTPVSQVAQAGARWTDFGQLRNSLGMALARHGSSGDGNAHPQSRLAASSAGAKVQGGSGPDVVAGGRNRALGQDTSGGSMTQGGGGQILEGTGTSQGEAGSAKGQGTVQGSAGRPWGREGSSASASAVVQGQAGSGKGQGAVQDSSGGPWPTGRGVIATSGTGQGDTGSAKGQGTGQGSAGRSLAHEAGSEGPAVQGATGLTKPARAIGAGSSGQTMAQGQGDQAGQRSISVAGTSGSLDSKVSASSPLSSSQTGNEQGTQQAQSKARPQATVTKTAAQISGPPNRMPSSNAVDGSRPSGRFGLPPTKTKSLKFGSRKSISRRPYSDAVVESGSQTSSDSSSSSSVYRPGISGTNVAVSAAKQQGQGSQGGSDGSQGGPSVSQSQFSSSKVGQASVSTSHKQGQASVNTIGASNAAVSIPGGPIGQSVTQAKSSITETRPYIPPTKTKAGPSPFRKQEQKGTEAGKTGGGAVLKVPVEREVGAAGAGGSGGSGGAAGKGSTGKSAPATVIHPEILRREQPVALAQTGGPDLSVNPESGGTTGPNNGSGGSGRSGTVGSRGNGGNGGQGGWTNGGQGSWPEAGQGGWNAGGKGGRQAASTGGQGGVNTGGQGSWTDGGQGGNTGSSGQGGRTSEGKGSWTTERQGSRGNTGSSRQGGWTSGGKGSWASEGQGSRGNTGGNGQGGWESGGKGSWAAEKQGSRGNTESSGQGGWTSGGKGSWASEGQGSWINGGQGGWTSGGKDGGQASSAGGNNGATGGSGPERRCSSNPVCASDGYTYLSDCYLKPGLEKACDGFCPCKQPPPPPKPAARPPTARPGRFKPPPCRCDDVYDPVCGINGETYPNDCERRCAYVGVHCAEACPCGSIQKPIPSNKTIAKYNLTADGLTQAQAALLTTTTLYTPTTIGTTTPPPPTTMPYVPTTTPFVPPTTMYVHTAPLTRLKQAPRTISTTQKSKKRNRVRSRSRPGRKPRTKRPKKKPTTPVPTTPKPEPIEKEPLEQEAGAATTTTQAPVYDYYNSASSNTAYYDMYNPGPYYSDPYNVNNNQYPSNNNVNSNVYTPYKNPGACECPRYSSPVCGTDGITYENPCTLNCAHVGFGCGGECPCYVPAPVPSSPVSCESQCPAAYSPACSVNGNTYDNYCMMECSGEQEACNGECPCQYDLSYTNTDVNNEPSNQPLSTCECAPNDVDPVCTLDGETIWYGCEAICLGVTIACSSVCPC